MFKRILKIGVILLLLIFSLGFIAKVRSTNCFLATFGDLDCSGRIDGYDVMSLFPLYSTDSQEFDLDANGVINVLDLSFVTANIGMEVSPTPTNNPVNCDLNSLYDSLCTRNGESGFIPVCDFDQDGEISFIDYSMYVNQGGKTDSRERIWQQIITPSEYKAHVIRSVDGEPDISLERIRLVGIIFWPKGELPQMDMVRRPLEDILAASSGFWAKALDDQAVIRSEYLPLEIVGKKYGDEYTFDQIITEIEDAFQSMVTDQELRAESLEIINRTKNGIAPCPSSKEYLDIVVVVIKGSTRAYSYRGSSSLQLTSIPVTLEELANWQSGRIDNLFAHEIGHGLSFPDQYRTNTANDDWWYDPDPNNIMGSNMWGLPLAEMHLALSVKQWVLNKAE